MIKQLPLVIFTQQNQLYAMDASFVRGQGRTDFLAADALLLPFQKLFVSSTAATVATTTVKSAHWLRLSAGKLNARGQNAWLLGIEGDAELVELPAEQIHALPPHLLARRTFPALQAVAWYQQRLVSIIDARVLQGLAHPWLASVTPDVSQAE